MTEHRFVHLDHQAKLGALVRELEHADRGRTLVFVRTKRGADRLVKRLKAQNVTAVAMHGNKSQSQRQKALASFESGRVDTLVATDVAARGIDVPDVTHVINFDAPEDRDAYVHRTGRTGRGGTYGHRRELRDGRPDPRHAPDRGRPRAEPRVRPRPALIAAAGVPQRSEIAACSRRSSASCRPSSIPDSMIASRTSVLGA